MTAEANKYSANSAVLELDLSGIVRYASKEWLPLMGITASKMIGRPISDFVCPPDSDIFLRASREMQEPSFQGGSMTVWACMRDPSDTESAGVSVEAQGITVDLPQRRQKNDKSDVRKKSGAETVIWLVSQYAQRPAVSVTLPDELVRTTGFATDVFATYLETLADAVRTREESVPAPPQELCRICERFVKRWWFERHHWLCAVEHKYEDRVRNALDLLHDHREDLQQVFYQVSAQIQMQSQIVPKHAVHVPSPLARSVIGRHQESSQIQPPASPSDSTEPSMTYSPYFPVKSALSTMIERCDVILELSPTSVDAKIDSTDMESLYGSSNARILTQFREWDPIENVPKMLEYSLDATTELIDGVVASFERFARFLRYGKVLWEEVEAQVLATIEATIAAAESTDATVIIDQASVSDGSDSAEGRAVAEALPNQTEAVTIPAAAPALTLPTLDPSPASPIINQQQAIGKWATNVPVSPKGTTGGAHASLSSIEYSDAETEVDQACRGRESRRLYGSGRSGSVEFEPFSESEQNDPVLYSDDEDEMRYILNLKRQRSVHSRRSSCESNIRSPHLSPHLSPHMSPHLSPHLSPYSGPFYGNTKPLHTNPSAPTLPPTPTVIPSLASSSSNSLAPSAASSPARRLSRSIISDAVDTTNYNGTVNASGIIPSRSRSQSHSNSNDHSRSNSIQFYNHDSNHESNNSTHSIGQSSDNALSPTIPATGSSAVQTTTQSIRDYEILKPISRGAYGVVYLAKKKLTSELVAIKVLQKMQMVAKNQVTHIRHERRILISTARSPYVATLYYSFQSRDYLYLVMEYVPGGDVAALLKNVGCLSESWAKQYISEVIVAVDSLHSQGILHRDLKPDNLLINKNGHLKLSDFGLSSARTTPRLRKRKSRTGSGSFGSSSFGSTGLGSGSFGSGSFGSGSFGSGSSRQPSPTPSMSSLNESQNHKILGTPDYLAPETIEGNTELTEAADWWAVGCIFFELVYGYPPFNDETPQRIFNNIVQGKFEWPELPPEMDISKEAKQFISQLLQVDPSKRLGARGSEEVLRHPYFGPGGINAEELFKTTPEYIPPSSDPQSTSNFDARGATGLMLPAQETDLIFSINGDEVSQREGSISSQSSSTINIPGGGEHHRQDSRTSESSLDEFGNFAYRNLPVLEKANNEVITKIRDEDRRLSFSGSISPLVLPSSPSSPTTGIHGVASDLCLSGNAGSIDERRRSSSSVSSLPAPPPAKSPHVIFPPASTDDPERDFAFLRMRRRQQLRRFPISGKQRLAPNVLVCGDDKLCEQFRKLGCNAIRCADANEACIQATSPLPLRLIVLDLPPSSPIPDTEVVRIIRGTVNPNRDVKIVKVSESTKENEVLPEFNLHDSEEVQRVVSMYCDSTAGDVDSSR